MIQSQRDCVHQPRSRGVARDELPWENRANEPQLQRGCGRFAPNPAPTPLGLGGFLRLTQGSSCLATLGWRTQSRWDCLRDRVEMRLGLKAALPWAFWRPLPVRRMEMPDLPAAIFRNGAASSFRAKQTSLVFLSKIYLSKAVKPACSKCWSPVRAWVMPSSRMTTKETQSVNGQSLSGREA